MKRLSLRGNNLLSDFYCILTTVYKLDQDALNFNEILAAVTTSVPFALTVTASVSRISTFTHRSPASEILLLVEKVVSMSGYAGLKMFGIQQ